MLRHVLRSALIVALLITICMSVPAARAAPLVADPLPGEADLSFGGFGGNGIVTAFSLNGRGMALQLDGKIVIVGAALIAKLLIMMQ